MLTGHLPTYRDPLALNLHVLLDDVSEFNGPLWFIPGSHKGGPVPAELDACCTARRPTCRLGTGVSTR